jgi:hypothetical protein
MKLLWRISWLVRLPHLVLRTLSLVGAILALAVFGGVAIARVGSFVGIPWYLSAPVGAVLLWACSLFAADFFGRTEQTTLVEVLACYVFVKPGFPTARSGHPHDPNLALLIVLFGGICPCMGVGLPTIWLGPVIGFAVPDWLINIVFVLVFILGCADTLMLVARRYPELRSQIAVGIRRRWGGRGKKNKE